MAIQVKFFASLREQIGCDAVSLEPSADMNVQTIWRQASGRELIPPNVLCAVNLHQVHADHPVQDGDEVAFFPPMTGG